MTTTTDTDAAAEVRRSVTRECLRTAGEVRRPKEFTEAIIVAKHLRAGDPESAIRAHAAIRRMILMDLREIGCAEECFLSLANALHDYLAAEGYEFHAGRWQLSEAAVVASGPRLVLAG
jgi:hypothetical protein